MMAPTDIDVRQGTLDLLVLKAIDSSRGGSMHGYDILEWLRDATDQQLRLEDAALYPALHRMEARGLIAAKWGVSANNRRARFYQLTAVGRQSLKDEAASWRRYTALVAKVLGATHRS
jgi:PadR family transcriptional regulator PadR